MQKDPNRDRWVEPMLRQTMSAPLTPPVSPSCLDGETIAAWAERALRQSEAEHVEQHLSECARCSALLATLVRTTPETTASGWRFWHVRWLVPAATAATVVAIWFAVPGNQGVPGRDAPAAQREAKVDMLKAPADQAAAARSEGRPTETSPVTPEQATEPGARGALQRRSAAPTPSAQSGAPAGFLESSQTSRAREQTIEKRADSTAATPTARAEPPATRQADAVADRDPARDSLAPEAPDAKVDQRPANATEPQTPRVAAAAPAPPPSRGESAAGNRAAAAMRPLGARVANTIVEIPSPNPANRWRITDGRVVERSTTGGTTWEPASASAPEALTAGSSPSPLICWLVGRAGAILVTVDGVRFARVPFPETIDLVSVRAVHDREATVTAADRRSFRTNDRGLTWTPVP